MPLTSGDWRFVAPSVTVWALLLLVFSGCAVDYGPRSPTEVLGRPPVIVKDVAVDPSHGGRLYVALNSGVYRSNDYGESWVPAGQGLPEDASLVSLALDPNEPSTLYASGYVYGQNKTTPLVYRSTDAGGTWTPLGVDAPELDGQSIGSVMVAPTEPRTLFAGTNKGALLISRDGGNHWSSQPLASPSWGMRIALASGNYNRVYVAADKSGDPVVYKSDDGGITWKAIEGVFPREGGVFSNLEVAPADPNVVYLGMAFRVYKSRDAGETWRDITEGLPRTKHIGPLVVSPSNADEVYVALYEVQCKGTCWVASMSKSDDGGKTWTDVLTDWQDVYITTLKLDPSATDRLYMGTNGLGLYKSDDRGLTRHLVSTGLPGR